MLCASCVHWTVEQFSYGGLQKRWGELIPGKITPGYKNKFQQEASRANAPFLQTRLLFKYCSQGCINRFYLMRNARDAWPRKNIVNCSSYATVEGGMEGIPIPGVLWSICATESHGTSTVKGHTFYPGLYEKAVYFRLPAHRQIRPDLGVAGKCEICASEFEKGIRVKETSYFCCNKHYLEWWRTRNPDAFQMLNVETKN